MSDTAQRKKPAQRAFAGCRWLPTDDDPTPTATAAPVPGPPVKKALAGSPLQPHQTKAQKMVLLHFCFDQLAGDQKQESCTCKTRVPLDEAIDLVQRGCADWLLMRSKTAKPARNTRAVVIRRMCIDDEVLFAVNPPAEPDRRGKKHERIKQGIRNDARKVLQKLFSKGCISQRLFETPDAQLDDLFQDRNKFEGFLNKLAELGQYHLREQMIKVIKHWWNNVLGYQRLDVAAGTIMPEADRGAGELVCVEDAESIAAAHQHFASLTRRYRETAATDGGVDDPDYYTTGVGRRATVSGQRASFWNGAWDFSTGSDPRGFLKEDSDDNEAAVLDEQDESARGAGGAGNAGDQGL